MLKDTNAYKVGLNWLRDSHDFFIKNAKVNAEHNWQILRPMSVLYLVFFIVVTYLICPHFGIPLDPKVILILTSLHSVLCLWIVFSQTAEYPVAVVNAAISFFGCEILFAAGYFEFAAFRSVPSFIFPSCIVLMTQIYTRHPFWRISETLCAAVIYLICSWHLKGPELFLIDFMVIFIAVMIALLAVFSITMYMLRYYHTTQALEKMCDLDPMTGVNNKPTFQFRVESYLKNSKKKNYALEICDLDNFKNVNDTYGHRAGDTVITNFAEKFHQLEKADERVIAGRFGGDEFVIFFKQYLDEDEIRKHLQPLCSVEGPGFTVTSSIGVACAPAAKNTITELFDCADQCLYQAKASKLGQIVIANAEERDFPSNN
jgi:diguanylate cyclase (GGDEF)-like protein